MSAEEYEYQLQQVEEVLKADPTNSELLKLRASLTELIQLVHATNNVSSASSYKKQSSSSTATSNVGGGKEGSELGSIQWSKGQRVMAKYKDGLFYEAVVDSIHGDRPVPPPPSIPSIACIGSNSNKKAGEVSPLSSALALDAANKKRSSESVFGPPPSLDRKKAKSGAGTTNGSHSNGGGNGAQQTSSKPNKKKEDKEEVVKQKAWLAFAAKGGSKKAAAHTKKSMFSTPDDPLARVGIIGKPSAQNLTQFKDRTKHIFDA
ncbi:hypothetical protein SeMB42_g03349 [Synchytrium endobioticum]|uniref:Tudor domain-containing protein n=1 Tax=Synchytrium endobioticum TaxID=286115 RepID=A0A507D762_9FUNG|nr:hypothetical protein SeMB42_g03349 [Synchytrium endobioticum]TPX48590.1 hypothetical protein SeLEV6574_g01938 [Synchytrium endobioticum]